MVLQPRLLHMLQMSMGQALHQLGFAVLLLVVHELKGA